jgi:propanol-preferring alcohol dehydrogenase
MAEQSPNTRDRNATRMQAMVLDACVDLAVTPEPLRLAEVPMPVAGDDELLIQVLTCGVCHTELDEIEGRTPPVSFPAILGHQVVGLVVECGERVTGINVGDRVGVAWIHSSCGTCRHCREGRENLCARFRATGRDAPGGYAEFMTVPALYAYPIPARFTDAEAAPLLCAGAIGHRSLRLAELKEGQTLGLMGFGASAHLCLQLARHRFPGLSVCVFARKPEERAFALELGAAWAGDTDDAPPQPVDAIIDTTPVWGTVLAALAVLAPGGRLVINAIRKEEADKPALLRLDYPRHLWMEKSVQSVANVTRDDVREFLELAARIPLRPSVEEYPLAEANRALLELKQHRVRGAKVLRVSG